MRRNSRFRSAPRGARPSRTWADISSVWLHSGVTATSAATLISMQAPTSLAALTSDIPEDLTILRIRGSFNVQLDAVATSGNWTLALIVQDTTWTPGATVSVDNDKRMLWLQDYAVRLRTSGAAQNWEQGGIYQEGAELPAPCNPMYTTVDIAPKVKIEPGKALFLVAYENVDGASFTTGSTNMRVLVQRTARRR